MKFWLEIDCDTVAFGDQPELYLSDILRGIANTIKHVGSIGTDEKPWVLTPVVDVNGIRCGTWELSKKI